MENILSRFLLKQKYKNNKKGANLAALIGLFGDFWTAKSFCERRLWRHLFHRLAGYGPADDEKLHTPTFVNFHGRAKFSNMMLSSFADSYSPRLLPQYLDVYINAYREKTLVLADVRMMDAELCN